MPSFEPQNETVCKHHSVMFKHDKFTIHPQKDLVLSLPYQFVPNLEPGQFTPLDKLWLKNLNGILKKATSNSIKQIRLVRLLRTNYFWNHSITFRNSNEDVIYEVVPMVHLFLTILIGGPVEKCVFFKWPQFHLWVLQSALLGANMISWMFV